MNRSIILLMLFSVSIQGLADEFKIVSFRPDRNDLAAIRFGKKDANDHPCAIIKIFTDLPGLKFEANQGIVEVLDKKTEYWIYVSAGERRLRFLKEGFIPLGYDIPEIIEASVVYNIIVKGTGENISSAASNFTSGMLLFKTEPPGAEVWINDEYAGLSTISKELEEGKFNYKVNKRNFHPTEGKFIIDPGKTTTISIPLEAMFGSVSIETSPEQNAEVELDGIILSNRTPLRIDTLQSGKHLIVVRKELYEPLRKDFILKDRESLKLSLDIKPLFGTLEITTLQGVSILIDAKPVGTTYYKGRLLKGIHTIEVQGEKYYSVTQKYAMEVGKTDKLELKPKPKTGSLSVMSEPPEADIFIDNENMGLTPKIFPELLIGQYEVTLKKEGFATIRRTIEIKENSKTPVNEKFMNLMEVTFRSDPDGADLLLNSELKGETPRTLKLPIGKYSLELQKKGYLPLREIIDIKDGTALINKHLDVDTDFMARKKKKTRNWIWGSIGTVTGVAALAMYTNEETKYISSYVFLASVISFSVVLF